MVQTVFEIIDNTDRNRIQFESAEHKEMYRVIVTCEENRNQYKPWEMEPIPLDESWLLRFGFTKCESGFDNIDLPYWVKNGVCLFYNESPPENTYLIGQGFSYENLYYAARNRWIDSVHELMNIYFAITGEELELKN